MNVEQKARELLAAEVAAMPKTWEPCDYAEEYEKAALRAIARALEQPEGREAVADPEPPSNEVWPPDGAVWLAPVATDAPANPKLMQYAWGRSGLSSGQMAEAYQCIVSAAQECGQVYRLPVTAPPAKVPEGYVLVPVEPTPEMVNAVAAVKLRRLHEFAAGKDGCGVEHGVREEWAAMLAAAQQPKEGA